MLFNIIYIMRTYGLTGILRVQSINNINYYSYMTNMYDFSCYFVGISRFAGGLVPGQSLD